MYQYFRYVYQKAVILNQDFTLFSVHEMIMMVRRIVRDQIIWYVYCFFWYIVGAVLKILVHNMVHVRFFWYRYHFFWYTYHFWYTYPFLFSTRNCVLNLRTEISHIPKIRTRNQRYVPKMKTICTKNSGKRELDWAKPSYTKGGG